MLKHALVAIAVCLAIFVTMTGSAPAPQEAQDQPTSNAESLSLTSGSTSGTEIPISSDEVTRTSTTARPTARAQSTTTTTTETTTSSEPIDFTSYKNTSTFSCDGKITGYYADVKLNCRVYHFCTQLDGVDGPSYQRMSYMCLENSFFDQGDLNCVDQADLKVTCDKAEAQYEKSNKQFDAREESQPSMSDNLAANLMMNPIARFIAGR